MAPPRDHCQGWKVARVALYLCILTQGKPASALSWLTASRSENIVARAASSGPTQAPRTVWRNAIQETRGSGRKLLVGGTASCPDGSVTDKYVCNCQIASADAARDMMQIIEDRSRVDCQPMCGDKLPDSCSEPPSCPNGIQSTCVVDGCGTHASFESVQVIRGANCKFARELGLLACSPFISVDMQTHNAISNGLCIQSCEAEPLRCSFPARFGDEPGELGLNLEKPKEDEEGEAPETAEEEDEKEDECPEVYCRLGGCTARIPTFAFEAIQKYKCEFLEENQNYNCGPTVAVDSPSFSYARNGICTSSCEAPNADLSCSFRARLRDSLLFEGELLVAPAPAPGPEEFDLDMSPAPEPTPELDEGLEEISPAGAPLDEEEALTESFDRL